MTDIVRYQPTGWVDTLPAIGDLAVKIADTAFVPETFRHKPAEVAAAILTGQEVGLGPMASLSGIAVIKGKPTMSAATMRALILSHGHELWPDDMTDTRVVLCGRRRGSENVARVTYTMDDAKRAGLAGSDTYRKYPRAMLLARATGELARLLFADVVAGIAYTPEELDLVDAPTDEAPPAPAKATRTAQRRTPAPVTPAAIPAPAEAPTAPPPVDEPPLDDLPPAAPSRTDEPTPPTAVDGQVTARPPSSGEAAEGPGGPPITKSQSRMLHALFNQLHQENRDDRLAMAAEIIGRPIGSSNDLTKEEASQVIDTLSTLAEMGEVVDAEVVDEPETLV